MININKLNCYSSKICVVYHFSYTFTWVEVFRTKNGCTAL